MLGGKKTQLIFPDPCVQISLHFERERHCDSFFLFVASPFAGNTVVISGFLDEICHAVATDPWSSFLSSLSSFSRPRTGSHYAS